MFVNHEEYVEIDSKRIFALRVKDDNMETEFHEGDVIGINPSLKPEHNDYVIVCSEDGEATFKQLKKVRQNKNIVSS